MIRTLWLFFVTASLLGCDQDAHVGDPWDGSSLDSSPLDGGPSDGSLGASPITLGQFLETFVEAYCGRIESCCGGLPSDFPSRDWCTTPVTDGLGEAAYDALDPAARASAQTCIRAVAAMGCMEPNDSRWPTSLFWTAEAQAACLEAPLPRAGCAQSACDGECVDGVCVPPVPRGDSCCLDESDGSCVSSSSRLCQRSDYCDFEGDYRCHARKPIGADCAEGAECLSLLCDPATSRCQQATLQTWTCP